MTGAHVRGSPALWMAIAATVLSLGLPLVADLPGRLLTVRVLLVGAIVLLAFAVAGSTGPRRRDHLVLGALGLLILTAALVIRAVTPTGVVLLAIAIASLLWQRRVWARAEQRVSVSVRGQRPN